MLRFKSKILFEAKVCVSYLQIILSQLYFWARRRREGSITPPLSLVYVEVRVVKVFLDFKTHRLQAIFNKFYSLESTRTIKDNETT